MSRRCLRAQADAALALCSLYGERAIGKYDCQPVQTMNICPFCAPDATRVFSNEYSLVLCRWEGSSFDSLQDLQQCRRIQIADGILADARE